ncbi:MAG: AMP-binding protein [Paramuribaculum sp.]|nr:AMP-binding protein [Paramuribaculum sp.]
MGNTSTSVDYSRITGLTPEAEDFLAEWRNEREYINAHTSGSTGVPKEVHLLKRDMYASARATNRFFGVNCNSTLSLPLSADYIAGKMMIVRALIAGCRLIIEKPSLNPLSQHESGTHIDLTAIVPSQLSGLLENASLLPDLGAVIIGGAPLTECQERMIVKSGINAYATYGMTETCSHVALRRIGKENYFTAMPDIRFETDSRGCLIINAPKFSFSQLVTNDCVELLDPTHFRWLGRADNVINTGAIKVFAETLEKRLAPFSQNHTFYIHGRQSERWGEEIVMTVESAGTFDRERFMIEASAAVGHRLLPKEIFEVNEIPRTSSGKIIRSSHNGCDGLGNDIR